MVRERRSDPSSSPLTREQRLELLLKEAGIPIAAFIICFPETPQLRELFNRIKEELSNGKV